MTKNKKDDFWSLYNRIFKLSQKTTSYCKTKDRQEQYLKQEKNSV